MNDEIQQRTIDRGEENRDGVRRCGACRAVGYPEDRYCSACGRSLQPCCTQCGAESLHPFAFYCTRCGSPLEGRSRIIE